MHRGDRERATHLLISASDAAALDLRALMLLAVGDSIEAEHVLTQVAHAELTAEHWRVVALCHFAKGRLGEALLAVKKAEEKAPSSLAVTLAVAAIEYF